MKNYNKIMEVFWLVVAIVTFVYAIIQMLKPEIGLNGAIMLIPPIAAFGMYYLRRRFRVKQQDEKTN
jgi:uncharacterized membrane protein